MQKPNSKKNRAKNAAEFRWQQWLKEQPCSFCGSTSGSIVDHCKGSTFKHNKRMIGEIFCNSKCLKCDTVVTLGTRRDLFSRWGITDSDATINQLMKYRKETSRSFPMEDIRAIADVYAENEEITDWMKVL